MSHTANHPRGVFLFKNGIDTNVSAPFLSGVTPEARRDVPHIVIQLPVEAFNGSHEGLRDYKVGVDDGIPRAMVETLLVIAHLTSHLDLGTANDAEDPSAEGRGGDDDDEEGGGGAAQGEGANSPFRVVVGQEELGERIEHYFEVVRSDDELHAPIAYRYHLFFPDRTYDIDRAIEKLCMRNAKRKPSKSAAFQKNGGGGTPTIPKNLRPEYMVALGVKSRADFIKNHLTPFTGATLLFNKRATFNSLYDDDNPASLFTVFSLENAMNDETIRRMADPLQTDLNQYRNAAEGVRFPNAEDVWHIRSDQFTPAHLFVCRFPHRKMPETKSDLHLSAEEREKRNVMRTLGAIKFYESRKPPTPGVKSEDEFEKLATRNAALFETMWNQHLDERAANGEPAYADAHTAELAKRQLIYERRVSDTQLWIDFEKVFSPYSYTNPRMNKIAMWYSDYRDEWSMKYRSNPSFVKAEPPIDNSYSPFANMKFIRFRHYEEIMMVYALHFILDLLFAAAMGAYSPHFGMRCNIILSGGAETGKSYLFSTLGNDLMIPETATFVDYETPKARATSTSADNEVVIHDELDPALVGIGPNGRWSGSQGDPIFKAQLTRGETTTRSFYFTEEGDRITVTSTTRARRVLIMGSNDSKKDMAPPINTRTFIYDCPHFKRLGRSPTELAFNREIFNAGVNKDSKEFREEVAFHRKLQFLYALAEKLIECRLLTPPTMTIAYHVFQKMNNYVEEKGYSRGKTRNQERLMAIARTHTIMSAIYTVFCTNLVYRDGHPFCFKDMLELEPYMMCTEEIAIYTYTSMISQIVDPMEANIVQHLFKHSTRIEKVLKKAEAERVSKRADADLRAAHHPPSPDDIRAEMPATKSVRFAATPDDPSSSSSSNNNNNNNKETGESAQLKMVNESKALRPEYVYIPLQRFITKSEAMGRIAKIIHADMAHDKVELHISGITDILFQLMQRSVRYVKSTTGGPAEMEVGVETEGGVAPPDLMPCAIFESTTGCFGILDSFQDNMQPLSVSELSLRAAKRIQHKHTRHRFITTASPHSLENRGVLVPHILRTLTLKPTEEYMQFMPLVHGSDGGSGGQASSSSSSSSSKSRGSTIGKDDAKVGVEDEEDDMDEVERNDIRERRKVDEQDGAIQRFNDRIKLVNADLEDIEFQRHVNRLGRFAPNRFPHEGLPANYCLRYFNQPWRGIQRGAYPARFCKAFIDDEQRLHRAMQNQNERIELTSMRMFSNTVRNPYTDASMPGQLAVIRHDDGRDEYAKFFNSKPLELEDRPKASASPATLFHPTTTPSSSSSSSSSSRSLLPAIKPPESLQRRVKHIDASTVELHEPRHASSSSSSTSSTSGWKKRKRREGREEEDVKRGEGVVVVANGEGNEKGETNGSETSMKKSKHVY